MTDHTHENNLPVFGIGTLLLAFFSMLGLVLVVYRWITGLGATTGLSDGRGWGLWISFDVLCGIALAAGAFCVAGTVYILHLKEFYPILRPTVLTGFLGYALAAFAIAVDLGFPYRIFNMIIYWNLHSPLFEVGWCVMIYSTVLALELSPIVFEQFNMKVPLRIIRAITIPLVILGVILSTMHQSSLGTLFVLMPHRVHPLWYSQILPLLFLVSAIAAGLAMVIIESTLSSNGLKQKMETRLLAKIAGVIPFVLAIYMILKFGDIILSNDLDYMFNAGYISVLFWIEILISIVLPMILFSIEDVRRSPAKMFSAALLVIMGLLLNRFNISQFVFSAAPYAPTWLEMFVTIGMVAIGTFVFTLASRFLPVFSPHEVSKTSESQPIPMPTHELVPSLSHSQVQLGAQSVKRR